MADVGKGRTAKQAVRTAKNVLEDFGAAAQSCTVIATLAKSKEWKAEPCQLCGIVILKYCPFTIWKFSLGAEVTKEEAVHRVAARTGLRPPVPITTVKILRKARFRKKAKSKAKAKGKASVSAPVEPPRELPAKMLEISIICASDFLKFIAGHDFWHVLFGQDDFSMDSTMMKNSWSQYRLLWPGYELFARADRGQVDLQRCLPCYVHGDEGTYFKQGAIMIAQWQSVLGCGTLKCSREAFADRLMGESLANPFVNHRGVTISSRLLLGVLPKEP